MGRQLTRAHGLSPHKRGRSNRSGSHIECSRPRRLPGQRRVVRPRLAQSAVPPKRRRRVYTLDLPIYLFIRSDLADEGAGLGDVAFDGRVGLIDRNTSAVGLAVGGRVTLPTASIASPLGAAAGTSSWEVQLILDKEVGPVLLDANLGYRGIPEQQMINVI
jgi:hypothetical protein